RYGVTCTDSLGEEEERPRINRYERSLAHDFAPGLKNEARTLRFSLLRGERVRGRAGSGGARRGCWGGGGRAGGGGRGAAGARAGRGRKVPGGERWPTPIARGRRRWTTTSGGAWRSSGRWHMTTSTGPALPIAKRQ